MRSLHEIILDEIETAHPMDTLDTDFDTFESEMLPMKYAVEDGE